MTVAFHSEAWLGTCLESFRQSARAAGFEAETVVVDHGQGETASAALAASAPDRLVQQPNRGYAAGLNRGLREASGDLVLLANPDLAFAPPALGALVAALDEGWDVVGPQFTLGPFFLPPADPQSPFAELRRWRGRASPRAAAAWLEREVRRWQRVWDAGSTVEVPTLSGALLAARRETIERIGPWDEDYFLYFEETDWLLRARRLGLRLGQVPSAQVVHAWGHAAVPGSRDDIYATSRRRYFRKAWGWPRSSVVDLPPRVPPRLAEAPGLNPGAWKERQPMLALVSPSSAGVPAAGAWIGREELGPALASFQAELAHPLPLTVAVCERGRLLEVLEVPLDQQAP